MDQVMQHSRVSVFDEPAAWQLWAATGGGCAAVLEMRTAGASDSFAQRGGERRVCCHPASGLGIGITAKNVSRTGSSKAGKSCGLRARPPAHRAGCFLEWPFETQVARRCGRLPGIGLVAHCVDRHINIVRVLN